MFQDGSYKLYGYKWFSSATDSDMTMTLARVVDSQVKNHKNGLFMTILLCSNPSGT